LSHHLYIWMFRSWWCWSRGGGENMSLLNYRVC